MNAEAASAALRPMQLWSFVLTSPTEAFLNILSLGCYFQPFFPLPRLRGYCCQVENNGAMSAVSCFILYTLENFGG
jgi:hypothetical protein